MVANSTRYTTYALHECLTLPMQRKPPGLLFLNWVGMRRLPSWSPGTRLYLYVADREISANLDFGDLPSIGPPPPHFQHVGAVVGGFPQTLNPKP